MTGIDEWLAQTNTMWIASLSLLPFGFVVLFVPTTINGHIAYIALWVATLFLVGFTSWLLSRAVCMCVRSLLPVSVLTKNGVPLTTTTPVANHSRAASLTWCRRAAGHTR